MEESRTFMKLCNCLRVLLTENRRAAGDWEHFNRIMTLRPNVDEEPDKWVLRFAERYPWKGEQISYYICLSHKNRMRINKWQNDLEKEHHRDKLFIASYGFVKGCSSQPQDMWVWPGMQLIGGGRTSRKVLNGVCYIVHSFDDLHLRVTTHPDFGDEDEIIELEMREASDNLRLCYAAVYHSCQGRTLKQQHVLLMDTHKKYFTGRHLYVGASRVTSGEYLHVASCSNAGILDKLKDVPLDNEEYVRDCGMKEEEQSTSIFGEDFEHLWD